MRQSTKEANNGEVRGKRAIVVKRIMTHEHERDTYTYTNQGKPYKLEAGGTSTNETNSQLGGKTVSGEAHDDT